MTDIFLEHLLLTVVLGLCLGSFATALVYRLPRGISMIEKERSSCPQCGRTLGVMDLVPVLSYIFLRGKCRSCKKPIGWRYITIELCTLLSCLAAFFHFGFSLPLIAVYFLLGVCIAIIFIDLEHMIIPDALNLSVAGLFILALILSALSGQIDFNQAQDIVTRALGGALLYGGLSLALRFGGEKIFKKESLGLGDVKFFAATGLWLGTGMIVLAWFMILAGGAGVILALFMRKWRADVQFPFGPALVLAFLALIFTKQVPIFQIM